MGDESGPSLAELLCSGDSLDVLKHDDSFKTPMAGGPAGSSMTTPHSSAENNSDVTMMTPTTATTPADPTNEPATQTQTYTAETHAQAPMQWRESVHQGNKFVLPEYYAVVRTLGAGAYGVVCHGVDKRQPETAESRNVAIKKIGRAFEHAIDARRTIREVKILREMKHDNIITLLDILPPMDLESFNDYYVVYQFMETDLHQIIRSKQELSEDHLQYFLYQILRGIKYVHSLGVVHRDLKPSNLLLNGNCDLKICDFGLARALGPADDNQVLTFCTFFFFFPPFLLMRDVGR